MSQQTIDIGTVANDGTGDDLRTAGDKINDNFTELYAAVAASGASWKAPARVATTAAITLATGCENGDTIDGVTLATGDRVLVKNQAAPAENGIYVVAASGAPARSADADSADEMVNAAVLVSEGTVNADKLFVCTTNAPITLNTTALTFADFTPSGSFTAASTTEVLTGTDSAKGATPDAIAALWEQGSDVASAGTISLGEGGYFNITGTTTITDIDFATDKAGRKAWVKFGGVLTLTHHATTLILPTGASITTAAGDTACFVSEGSDAVRCIAYQRASGQPLAGGGGSTFNGCYLYRSTTLAITPANTAIDVNFDSELYDTLTAHSTSSNTNRITVPSGPSYIDLHAKWFRSNDTNTYNIIWVKQYNSSDVLQRTFRQDNATGATSGNTGGSFEMNIPALPAVAGDYFIMQVQSGSGTGNANGGVDGTTFAARFY